MMVVYAILAIAICLIHWFDAAVSIRLIYGFFKLSNKPSVIHRSVGVTLTYLITAAVSSYILHPCALLLYDGGNPNDIKQYITYVINDIALFSVIYFAVSR